VSVARVTTLLVLALPELARACATCISSPYGDRSYNLAYLGLILTPFAVVLAIAGVFAGCWLAARRTVRPVDRHAGDDPIDSLNEETT
jgi:hypothetical protein